MDKKKVAIVGTALFALGAVIIFVGEMIGAMNGVRLIREVGTFDPEEFARAVEAPHFTQYSGAVLCFIGAAILAFVIFKRGYRKKWLWWWVLIVSILYFSYLSFVPIVYLIIRRRKFWKNDSDLIEKIDELGNDRESEN